jgi:1D-myo-inositol 3-kinase
VLPARATSLPQPAPPSDNSLEYLVVGHVTVDRVDDRRVVLGGTATYAALTAANLGVRVGIHTSAAYEPGLVNPLSLHGIRVARIPAEYSTCFVNEYVQDGKRQQTIESVAEPLTYEQLLPEWRHPPVVHLGPLCQEMDPALVERFPRSLVGVTPQGWLRAWGEDGVVRPVEWPDADRVLARVNAVVVSERDVEDPAIFRDWARKARLLVVTLGERGCEAYKRGEDAPYHSPAFTPAQEVDPTGAGDVFAAANFWHLHQTGTWREAADWANCVASFAVERLGIAGVPKLDDVARRWRSGARVSAGVGAP